MPQDTRNKPLSARIKASISQFWSWLMNTRFVKAISALFSKKAATEQNTRTQQPDNPPAGQDSSATALSQQTQNEPPQKQVTQAIPREAAEPTQKETEKQPKAVSQIASDNQSLENVDKLLEKARSLLISSYPMTTFLITNKNILKYIIDAVEQQKMQGDIKKEYLQALQHICGKINSIDKQFYELAQSISEKANAVLEKTEDQRFQKDAADLKKFILDRDPSRALYSVHRILSHLGEQNLKTQDINSLLAEAEKIKEESKNLIKQISDEACPALERQIFYVAYPELMKQVFYIPENPGCAKFDAHEDQVSQIYMNALILEELLSNISTNEKVAPSGVPALLLAAKSQMQVVRDLQEKAAIAKQLDEQRNATIQRQAPSDAGDSSVTQDKAKSTTTIQKP